MILYLRMLDHSVSQTEFCFGISTKIVSIEKCVYGLNRSKKARSLFNVLSNDSPLVSITFSIAFFKCLYFVELLFRKSYSFLIAY